MKSLPKLLSLFLALLLLLSVFTVAPISASAADETEQSTAVEETTTAKSAEAAVKDVQLKNGDDDVDETDETEETSETDETVDESATDSTEVVPDETLPEGDMAAPFRLNVHNIELYQGLDAEEVVHYDDEGQAHSWYYYSYDEKIKYTVTLEDGTELVPDEEGVITYNGVGFVIDISDDQDYETPWGAGNHTVDFSVLGLETTATVTVLESPVSSVEFKDVSCVAGTNGDIYSYYTYNHETGQSEFVRSYFEYDIVPEFTVTLADGTKVESEDGAVEILGETYYPSISIDQYLNPLKEGTYNIPATFLEKDYSFNFVITPSDIKSISVEDVSVFEGVDVTYCTTYLDEGAVTYTEIDYNPTITITLTDGTTVKKEYDDDEITIGENTYEFNKHDEQDYDNVWGPGEHSATIFVGDVSDDFNVFVLASPIKSISIKDVQVFDGLDTSDVTTHIDGEEYEWTYFNYTPEFTVTTKDGKTFESTNGYVIIDDVKYGLRTFDSQEYDNVWEPGSTYTATGRIGSVSGEFEVTVRDDAVKSVKVTPEVVNVTKGVDSYFTEGDDEPYERINYEGKVSLEITMYDGTVVTADDEGQYYYNGIYLPVEFIDAQSKDNVWGAGTYYASVAVFGTTAPITVKVSDTPAKKVEISKVTIIEGTHRFNSESCYAYLPKFTVTLSNGEKLESDEDGGVEYNDEYYMLHIEDDQSDENVWGIGTHTARGTILGVSAEFEVEIVETPVEKVEAKPLSLIAYSSGDWDYSYDPETEEETDKYFRYFSYPSSYTVTLKDGTTLTSDGDGDVFYNGEWYGVVDIEDNQSFDNQWTEGNTYNCTASVLGFVFEYQAEIVGTPVESVQIDDVIAIDKYDSYTAWDDYGRTWTKYDYGTWNASITVTFKDGTVVHSENGSVYYKGERFGITNIEDTQSYENQWEVGGVYPVTASVIGFETTFNVRVVENPIKSVKVNDVIKIDEFDENYGDYESYYDEDDYFVGTYFYYSPSPVNYTVTFKDGAVVNSDEEGGIYYNGNRYGIWFNYELTKQDYYNQWKAGGTYTAVATVLGFEVEYDVTIKSLTPPPATTIKLTAKKSKIYVGDKTTVSATVTNPVGTTTFKSSNPKVATVDSKGNVKAKKAGKVKITATNNGKSSTVTITVIKKKNPAKIKASAKTVKFIDLQKKAQTVTAISVKKAQGKVTYAKAKGDKKITVNKKNGKITLKKGMKRGKYTIKVKIKVKGNAKFKPLTKTVKVTITVK